MARRPVGLSCAGSHNAGCSPFSEPARAPHARRLPVAADMAPRLPVLISVRLCLRPVLLGCAVLVAACQPGTEAVPGIRRVPASAAEPAPPAEAGQGASATAAAVVPLQTQYAQALALLARHPGVHVGRIDGQEAVLWIDRGTTLRRGDEAVTLPRLQLYRASRAGSPQVLVDLRPEQQHGPQLYRFCAFSQGRQELPDASCDAVQRLVLAVDPTPAGTGDGLASRLEGRSEGRGEPEVIGWTRAVDAPGPAGEPARTDVAWFDAVVLRSARPQGAPQRRGEIVWQPMLHAVSGVAWDRLVALPDAEVLARVQREAERRVAIFVGQALEAQARGSQAQALIRVRHASPRWLVMEASTSTVASDGAQARERHAVWDLASGQLVRLADGFHYATLKRLDGGIALDLENPPSDGADADRGLLGAALRALGPRRSARCLQRWLQAHRCEQPSACEALVRLPDDLVLWPGEDGLVLQFDHALTEVAARESGRELPASLRGAAWASCVSDQVTLPWAVALQARRRDSRIELP